MSVGKLLFFVGILMPLCYATANKTIKFGGLAATLIPLPYPTLGLTEERINDPNQEWILPTEPNGFIHSANPNYPNHVWDVSDSSTKSGTRIILYLQKSVGIENQLWNISADGVITSALVSNYTATQNGSSNLYMTYVTPAAKATIADPIIIWQCSSVGDPHITPYPGGRNDLYTPGAQLPGTFTLSKTGVLGDPEYLQIQADQQLCQPSAPGIYCNKRGILQTLGHVIEVSGDVVTIDDVVTPVTGTLQLSNGLNVTKLGTNNYVVSYPDGQTQFQTLPSIYKYLYMSIFISATYGEKPSGGMCTPYNGPNLATTKLAVTPYDFCLSWRAPNITDDLFNYTSYAAWRAANPLSFNSSKGNCSSNNQTLIAHAYAYCAPLAANGSLATQCAGFTPTAPAKAVYQACLDDVICTGDYSFSASVIDGFTKQCTVGAGSGHSFVLPTSGANSVAAGAGLASTIDQSTTPVSFTITAKDVNGKTVTTGGDDFVVTISGGISFTQVNLGSGVYKITYTPSVVGTHVISVQLNGFTPIVNSPFTVNVASTQTAPSKSTASGPGLAVFPDSIPSGTFVSFTVVARTASGAPRQTGGDSVTFSVSGSPIIPNPSVVDNHDGTYTATYMQNLASANFTVAVSINKGAISGSPFTVFVNGNK